MQQHLPDGFIIHTAKFIKGATKVEHFPQDSLPQIAFAGRSNVGKSSMQNSLLCRKKLVKTSGTPGKTQEINFFLINERFYFVDLPGMGYARVPGKKREEMSRSLFAYLHNNPNLRGVVYLIDMKTCGTKLDLESVEILRDTGLPVLLVATKSDKLNRKETNEARQKIMLRFALDKPPLETSSLKNLGLLPVWEQILQAIHPDTPAQESTLPAS
jgi:GTP-binding protein